MSSSAVHLTLPETFTIVEIETIWTLHELFEPVRKIAPLEERDAFYFLDAIHLPLTFETRLHPFDDKHLAKRVYNRICDRIIYLDMDSIQMMRATGCYSDEHLDFLAQGLESPRSPLGIRKIIDDIRFRRFKSLTSMQVRFMSVVKEVFDGSQSSALTKATDLTNAAEALASQGEFVLLPKQERQHFSSLLQNVPIQQEDPQLMTVLSCAEIALLFGTVFDNEVFNAEDVWYARAAGLLFDLLGRNAEGLTAQQYVRACLK